MIVYVRGNIMKEQEQIYACWLMNCPSLSDRQKMKLYQTCESLEELYFSSTKLWRTVLSEKGTQALSKYTECWKPEEEYAGMVNRGIALVTAFDKNYPKKLADIPDPPFGLFTKGKWRVKDSPTVAIIGARDCSPYGEHVAREVAGGLAKAGITVVSGMARGIDGIAQRAALDVYGFSVGVLGSGVDVCYPVQNRDLYDQLTDKGMLISSFPLGYPAKPLNFPIRNRIVSGLADAVIVVEARKKSGTLITVDMALEQGREVYVVPGRITDELSKGCNALLCQGANVFTSTEEFIKEITGESHTLATSSFAAMTDSVFEESDVTHKLLELLNYEPKSIYEIMNEWDEKISLSQLSSNLMMLCATGKIRQISPGQFCLL